MIKNMLRTVLLEMVLMLNGGCDALLLGGGAGARTVACLKCELKSTEDALIDNTRDATLKALLEDL